MRTLIPLAVLLLALVPGCGAGDVNYTCSCSTSDTVGGQMVSGSVVDGYCGADGHPDLAMEWAKNRCQADHEVCGCTCTSLETACEEPSAP